MKDQPLYSSRFLLLSFSAFLFITSFKMIVPILTDVVDYYGGSMEKGLVISLFAAAALIARPFSGSLVDKVGRKPIIIFGALVCAVMGLLYTLTDGLILFLIIRFFHGFSTGFTPVGNTAYLADISPAHRRGEAMGIMGMMTSFGFALGPPIGKYISEEFGWNTLFIASSVTALISIALVSQLKETRTDTHRFKRQDLVIKKDDLFDRAVLIPFVIMILTIYSFGVASTSIFAQARSIGFPEKQNAIFFTISALTSFFFRLLAGRLSDRWGRRNIMFSGIVFAFFASLMLAFATTKDSFIAASVIYGVSIGINSPTIFAWTMDLADQKRLGRAMSTLFIAVEIGIIFGSLVSGMLMNLPNNAYVYIHLSSAVLCLIGLIILIMTKRDRPPTTAQQLQGT